MRCCSVTIRGSDRGKVLIVRTSGKQVRGSRCAAPPQSLSCTVLASPVLVLVFLDSGMHIRVRVDATMGVGRTTGELSLQTLQVRCRRAVLELTSDLCLLCLSPASAHGGAPSRTCGAAWGNLAAPLELVFLPGTHSSARIAAMRIRHHVLGARTVMRHARAGGRCRLYLRISVQRQTIFVLRHEIGSAARHGLRNDSSAAAASRYTFGANPGASSRVCIAA